MIYISKRSTTLWLTTFQLKSSKFSKFFLKFSYYKGHFFSFPNNLGWKNNQIQSYRSIENILLEKFFIWNNLSSQIYYEVLKYWNSNFQTTSDGDTKQSCRYCGACQLYSWQVFLIHLDKESYVWNSLILNSKFWNK